ncbi:DMT family transporter [Pseudovibrio sp. SPO723]|uniref:DMT family transporter n=1 Tax=Nesiotobacter zosterae TaxID=392721 RepID=UPI0029C469A4|nr:DMT family transporter [Pseudovibrio sp. SPO723]MDX5592971.1 DMT family transporter [Pseudovibrio sp. SPO723]
MAANQSHNQQAGHLNPSLEGVLLMLAGLFVLSVSDGMVKYLAQTFSPLTIAACRFSMQVLIVWAIASFKGSDLRGLIKEFSWPQVLRGVFLVLASLQIIVAFKVMPLTDVIAIFFIQPMVLTILSAVVLKEDVGPRRWIAVLMGFVGIMVIVRPGSGIFGAYALLPIGAATCFALYLMVTRKLSGQASLMGAQFVIGVTGSVIVIPLLILGSIFGITETPILSSAAGIEELWLPLTLLGLLAFVGMFGQGLIITAFERAPASLLAPLNYAEIISASLIGYVFFNEVPDAMVWLGVSILVASGIYLAHRERAAANAARRALNKS